MAKGLRSKIRKYWASERRKAFGVPAETKQLEEQATQLKESLEKQNSQPSILRLKAVLTRPSQRRATVTTMEASTPLPTASMEVEISRPESASAPRPRAVGGDEKAGVVEMEVVGKQKQKLRGASKFKKGGGSREIPAKKLKSIMKRATK